MREVDPAVVRVLDVPAGVTLPELHDLLQVATSWTDSHLHQFVAGDVRYAAPDIDDFNEFEDERAETGVLLRALPARFTYWYDFGDDWHHDIETSRQGLDTLSGSRASVIVAQARSGHTLAMSVPERADVQRWSVEERAQVARLLDEFVDRPLAGSRPPKQRLLLLVVTGVGAVLLLPWIAYLAASLPRSHSAQCTHGMWRGSALM